MIGTGESNGIGIRKERALDDGEFFAGRSRNPHARPRGQCAHGTVDDCRRHGSRVHRAAFTCELVTDRDPCQRLRDRTERGLEGLDEEPCAELREAFPEIRRGVLRFDGNPFLCEDGAGIEFLHHALDSDAGFLVTGEDGVFDGRGATPSWKERCVEIHRGYAREVQNFLGEDLAVRDDDKKLNMENGTLRMEIGQQFFVDVLWLENG